MSTPKATTPTPSSENSTLKMTPELQEATDTLMELLHLTAETPAPSPGDDTVAITPELQEAMDTLSQIMELTPEPTSTPKATKPTPPTENSTVTMTPELQEATDTLLQILQLTEEPTVNGSPPALETLGLTAPPESTQEATLTPLYDGGLKSSTIAEVCIAGILFVAVIILGVQLRRRRRARGRLAQADPLRAEKEAAYVMGPITPRTDLSTANSQRGEM